MNQEVRKEREKGRKGEGETIESGIWNLESETNKEQRTKDEKTNPKSQIPNPKSLRRVPLFANEPQTLAELFHQAAERHNRPDALNYKKDGVWQPISSDQMISRAENIALGLYSLGLRKNDKAALLAANSPEWTLTDAGCQVAGI
ncbi:MAG TPA: AMP-binding protein, partial [Pyrinomonadaceae bacterium]|nr:AMP-binding protein [Pyrinomonadaceae bacterium]